MNPEPLWVSAFSRLTNTPPDAEPHPPGYADGHERVQIAVEVSDEIRDLVSSPIDRDDAVDVETDVASESPDRYGASHEEYARTLFEEQGFDAIAWYAPVSFVGPRNWGIYFNERALWGLAYAIARDLGQPDVRVVATELMQSVDRHETFHAAVELFALVADDMRRLLDPHLNLYDDGIRRIYDEYGRNVYDPAFPSVDCIEESLATAFQFRARSPVRGFSSALRKWVRMAPPAYAAWTRFRARADFDKAYTTLSAQMLGPKFGVDWVVAALRGCQPQIWTPPLAASALKLHGPIPRFLWRADARVPSHFAPSIFGNVRVGSLVACMARKFGATPYNGGRHPGVKFPNGSKVSYSTSWATAPGFFVKQLADAAGVTTATIKSTCL